MKLKEIKQSIISKITTNQRNLIKGLSNLIKSYLIQSYQILSYPILSKSYQILSYPILSGSSGATDMELFVKIVKSCQLTGSKLILCGNYSTVHIFVINYHLNKPEKKIQGYRKSTEYSVLFQTHINYTLNLWQ